MKIFGLQIGKNKDKEVRGINYNIPYGDALQFGTWSNSSAMSISAVYRAVELISDNIAMLPIKVNISDIDHKNEVSDHPINLAIHNGLHTKYNLIKLLAQSVMLKGNGFAYIDRASDGRPLSLKYLDSNDVQIVYNKNVGDLYYTCALVSNKKIEPVNMIHLVKNSYDGINGISILSYANRSINIASQTENTAENYFSNGGNLSGVLTVQGGLSQQQRQEIKSSWNQAYTNGGSGLCILPGNMQYQPIQINPKDSQMLESRTYNVDDIARFFGINPLLLGSSTTSNYNTIEAIQQQFVLHTLQPYITMFEEEFNRKLLLPSEHNLSINLDETYLLKTDKQAEANYYSSLLSNGVMCVNEVRKKLGLNPIEGGDRHTIAYSDVTQNTINNNQGNKEEEDGEKTTSTIISEQ